MAKTVLDVMIPAAAGAGVLRFILLPDFATGPHVALPGAEPLQARDAGLRRAVPMRFFVPILCEKRCFILTSPAAIHRKPPHRNPESREC